MVRSKKYCILSRQKDIPTFIDDDDIGCFFIIDGIPKIVTPIERASPNRINIFFDKNGLQSVV